jgi:flagellar biogenesis protein FliO
MGAAGVNLVTDVLPALVLVFGAPLGIWWYVRKTRANGGGGLRVTDKAVLGKNVWMAVVEVDDKRFLVGAGESGVGLISELEALPEPEPEQEAAPDPAETLNGITEQPRIGLVRRLQLMTVRGPAQSPWRSSGGPRN